MKPITWMILGASSIIAEEFAHIAAGAGHALLLVGRDRSQLEIIASDLRLRYRIECNVIYCDFSKDISEFINTLQSKADELALFIATSYIVENDQLTTQAIETLVNVNILSITRLVSAFMRKVQSSHRLLFLSSVAASRGRAKNSLYGASKAAIEIYLQGLQQAATPLQHITIARLGFIDTVQTFDLPGIFYASPPKACAKACWKAVYANKRQIYHPFFWRYIMAIITHLPFFLYKRLKV
jgi:short-subunit dehydrogenase